MKIKPTGDRKRKGVGVGKGDGEKKMCFLPLSSSLSLFWFFPALRFMIVLACSPNCPK